MSKTIQFKAHIILQTYLIINNRAHHYTKKCFFVILISFDRSKMTYSLFLVLFVYYISSVMSCPTPGDSNDKDM